MSEENVEIVREIFAAFARRDTATGIALLDPHVELDTSRVAVPGQQGVYHGRDSIADFWRSVLGELGALEFHVERFVDAGDDVVVQVRVAGQGRISGVPAELPFAAVYTLQDGLVVRLRAYSRLGEALEAAGLKA